MSAHTEQVASVLRRAIQDILARGLHDPRVRGLISVTRIKLSDDYAQATVFVSIMPQEQEKLSLEGLRSAAGHIRTQASRAVKIRRMPRLTFQLDRSIKREAAVLAAIQRAVAADSVETDQGDARIPSDKTPGD